MFILVSGGYNVQAQTIPETYSFDFRGELLVDALDQITRTAALDLVYDPQLLENYHVFHRVQNETAQGALKHILNEFGLDFLTFSSGTIVIIKAVSEGPFFGSISGKVTDLETGEPLHGATILLADASGGTSAGPAGNFALPRLLSGTHTIIFSYVGYEPVIKTIHIPPDTKVNEQISLEPKLRVFSPIIVQSHKQRAAALRGASLPASSDETRMAGWTMDPIRSLSFTPGIQYGLPMTGLHLQGGQKSDHRILLDGVPVYNPTSFGQLFSAFSPYAIGKIDLKKSGYGAEDGSQTGGMINFFHDLPSAGQKNATIQTDQLSYNARLNLSYERDHSTISIMSALRSSFWDTYQSPSIQSTLQNWDIMDPLVTNFLNNLQADASKYLPAQHQADVQFFDYHLAASVELDSYSTFSGSFYVAENHISTFLLNETMQMNTHPYLYTSDSNLWNNLAAQLKWNKMFTPRLDATFQGSYSSSKFTHQSLTRLTHYKPLAENSSPRQYDSPSKNALDAGSVFIPLPTWFDTNQIEHTTIRTDLVYSMTPAHTLQGGLKAEHLITELQIAESNVKTNQGSWITSGYLNSSHAFGTFWSIDWGSRLTYISQIEQVFAEPRLSVQYDTPDFRFGFLSLRASGGLYRQFINEFQITNTSPTAVIPSFSVWSHAGDLPVAKAWHLNGSLLLEPDEKTSLQIEAYYKWHPVAHITSYSRFNRPTDVISARHPEAEVSAFAEVTRMAASGAGMQLKRSLADSRLQIFVGYDYSYSKIDMATQFGRKLSAPWNQPHRINLRAVWRIKPALAVITNWQSILGRAWGFRDSYYNFLLFENNQLIDPFSFSTPEKNSLPDFHQLDLSVVYQPVIGPANVEIRLELINLSDRENVMDQYLLPVNSDSEEVQYEIQNRLFPGFYPSASISLTF